MKRARDDGAAAAAAKTKKKRRKAKKKKAADSWTQSTARHAFDVTQTSDHAETPVNAYEDLAPFLRAVGGRVYDPYYCDGALHDGVVLLAAGGTGRLRGPRRHVPKRGVRRVPVPRRHRLPEKAPEPEGPQAPEGGAAGAGEGLLVSCSHT